MKAAKFSKIFVVTLAMMFLPISAYAIDPLGGAVLGVGLNMFADRIQTSINSAGTNGRMVAIEASQQLWTTIFNAQQAFAYERDKTFEQLDKEAKAAVSNLYNAVDMLEKDMFKNADQIMKQAQSIALSLPFSDKSPQLQSFAPYFFIADSKKTGIAESQKAVTADVASISALKAPEAPKDLYIDTKEKALIKPLDISGKAGTLDKENLLSFHPEKIQYAFRNSALQDSVVLEVKGTFFYASDPDYKPVLLVGKSEISPIETTTNSLKFIVSKSVLSKSNPDKATFTTLNLTIPYPKGWWVFKKIHNANFKLLLTALPETPGSIVIETANNYTTTASTPKSTGTMYQHSNDDDLDLVHCGYTVLMPNYIDPSSAKFITEWSQGQNPDDWRAYLISTNPQVCYRVQTVHRNWGTSGKVNFRIGWNEISKEEHQAKQVFSSPMQWGQSKVIAAPGTWKVTFQPFDGTPKLELTASSNIQHKYLRIITGANEFTIYVPPANEMRW